MMTLEEIKEELGQMAGTFDADMAYQNAAAEMVRQLTIALHDAIRRPMGVIPESAVDFYDREKAERAEDRRRNL